MARNKQIQLAPDDDARAKAVANVLQRQSDELAMLIPDVVGQCRKELQLANDILDALNKPSTNKPSSDGEETQLPHKMDHGVAARHLTRIARVRELMLGATGLTASAPQNVYVLNQINGPQASPISPALLAGLSSMLGLPDSAVQEADVLGDIEES